MRKKIVLTFLIITFSINVFSIEKFLVERYKNSSAIALYPDSPIYQLYKKIEINFDGKTMRKRVIHMYQILNNTGRDRYSDYKILYNKDKSVLTVNEAITLNTDLSKTPVKKDSINTVNPLFLSGSILYKGIVEKVYSFPTVDPEDAVFIDYTLTTQLNYIEGEHAFSGFFPKEEEVFVIKLPKALKLYYKIKGNVSVKESLEDDKRVYSFSVKDIEKINEIEYLPPLSKLGPAVIFSTFKNWKLTKTIIKSKERNDIPVKFLDEFKKLKGEQLFIELFKYFKEKIKTVNLPLKIQGLSPKPVEKVLSFHEGSIIDKSFAFSSILKSLGYKSDVCLSLNDGFNTKEIPSFSQFKSSYSCVNYKGKIYYFDFSSFGSPAFWIPEYENSLLFSIKKSDFISYSSFIKNESDTKIKINIKKNKFNLSLNSELSGNFETNFRNNHYYKNKKELNKEFNRISQLISDGSINEGYKIEGLKNFNKRIALYYKVKGDNLFVHQKGAYIVELPSMPHDFTTTGFKLTKKDREYPLYIYLPFKMKTTYTINFNENIKGLYIPEELNLSGVGYSFKRNFKISENIIIVEEILIINKKYFSKEEYKNLKSSYDKFNERKQKTLILSFY